LYNKVVLVGRLTHDPELRYTGTGVPVVKYSLAVNRNYKNAQGFYETDFLNVVSWRKLAEISAKYLKKGKLILVEGRIQSRKYQAQDGSTRTAVDIQAEQMQMLDPKGSMKQDDEAFAGYAPPVKQEDYSSPPSSAPVPEKRESKKIEEEMTEPAGPDIDDIDFEDVPF